MGIIRHIFQVTASIFFSESIIHIFDIPFYSWSLVNEEFNLDCILNWLHYNMTEYNNLYDCLSHIKRLIVCLTLDKHLSIRQMIFEHEINVFFFSSFASTDKGIYPHAAYQHNVWPKSPYSHKQSRVIYNMFVSKPYRVLCLYKVVEFASMLHLSLLHITCPR